MDEIDKMKITIVKNGPYLVEGNIPLVKKTQIVSEYGEPLTWQTLDKIEAPTGSYALCRCGNSQHKPFCDGTHQRVPFDGKETAITDGSDENKRKLPGGKHLIVYVESDLCMSSGFCNLRNIGIEPGD